MAFLYLSVSFDAHTPLHFFLFLYTFLVEFSEIFGTINSSLLRLWWLAAGLNAAAALLASLVSYTEAEEEAEDHGRGAPATPGTSH